MIPLRTESNSLLVKYHRETKITHQPLLEHFGDCCFVPLKFHHADVTVMKKLPFVVSFLFALKAIECVFDD